MLAGIPGQSRGRLIRCLMEETVPPGNSDCYRECENYARRSRDQRARGGSDE
jgi:hypothetical protein